MARAIRLVVMDATLRTRLISAGLERAQRYTWERTAQGLWASVERMCQHAGVR